MVILIDSTARRFKSSMGIYNNAWFRGVNSRPYGYVVGCQMSSLLCKELKQPTAICCHFLLFFTIHFLVCTKENLALSYQ